MAQGIKTNLSKQELEELLKIYTLKEIAEKLNISVSTVKRYKNKYKLNVSIDIVRQKNSEKHQKYECDKTYFDNIDTMDKAYLLGFIAADGFVTNKNEVGIGVAQKDKKVIDFFKKELKSDKPIRENESNNFKS